MPAPVDARTKQQFLTFLKDGFSLSEAARQANVSYSWAKKYTKGIDNSGEGWRSLRETKDLPEPIPYEDLSHEAQRAWNDIGYFARRYFGAIAMPWQEMATERTVPWLESRQKEYVVINCPPGAGKTTYFSLIQCAWLTVRNRAIRGMIVTNTQRNAENYLTNLRRALDQPLPIKARDDEIEMGIAVDAEASIVQDFGLFKTPGESGERWTAKAFQVMQHRGRPVSEKESTWQAFGRGGAFLGNRLNVIVADDVYDQSMVKTSEAREDFMKWFDKHVETRLEPNGLLLLVGQRQGPDDVYRYCLDKKVMVDEDGDDVEDDESAQSKYHHVVFKAHYDELCKQDQHKNVQPYPEGCLLYPGRISWRDFQGLQAGEKAVEYQQEELSPESVLVDPLWVSGGVDPKTHIEYFGCLDKDRDEWELPPLDGEVFVVASCDPSPTMFWSIQVWAFHPDSDRRFLIAHLRKKMKSDELLDYIVDKNMYTGVMDEWQTRSEKMGFPIRHWIVEDNAAQKFMLQSDSAKRWMQQRGTSIVRHNTNWANKGDSTLGIQAVAPKWAAGKIRLPYAPSGEGRLGTLALTKEVTVWPQGRTDDAVMAHWFAEWNYPRLYAPRLAEPYKFARPSWLRAVSA